MDEEAKAELAPIRGKRDRKEADMPIVIVGQRRQWRSDRRRKESFFVPRVAPIGSQSSGNVPEGMATRDYPLTKELADFGT